MYALPVTFPKIAVGRNIVVKPKQAQLGIIADYGVLSVPQLAACAALDTLYVDELFHKNTSD